MEITVALDGEKKRDLRFFAGDDMSLTIVVYEHDGDITPITVSNVRFASADGSLPMDSEFVVPSNFLGRAPYRIVGEVDGITTTLCYGVMQTDGGWPSLFCWCSGPWPYGIVGKAENITVRDENQNFNSPANVESALEELGDFKKITGDITAAVDTAVQAAADAEAAAQEAQATLADRPTRQELASTDATPGAILVGGVTPVYTLKDDRIKNGGTDSEVINRVLRKIETDALPGARLVFESGRTYTYDSSHSLGHIDGLEIDLNGALLKRADATTTNTTLATDLDASGIPGRTMILNSVPANWNVGDLVAAITGSTDALASNVRRITAINRGTNTVTLNSALDKVGVVTWPIGTAIAKSFNCFVGRPSVADSNSLLTPGANKRIRIHGGTIDGNTSQQVSNSWRIGSEIILHSEGGAIYDMKFQNTAAECIVGHGLLVSGNAFIDLDGSALHTSVNDFLVDVATPTIFTGNLVRRTNLKGQVASGHAEGAITFSWGPGHLVISNNLFDGGNEALLGNFGTSVGANASRLLIVCGNICKGYSKLFAAVNAATYGVTLTGNAFHDCGDNTSLTNTFYNRLNRIGDNSISGNTILPEQPSLVAQRFGPVVVETIGGAGPAIATNTLNRLWIKQTGSGVPAANLADSNVVLEAGDNNILTFAGITTTNKYQGLQWRVAGTTNPVAYAIHVPSDNTMKIGISAASGITMLKSGNFVDHLKLDGNRDTIFVDRTRQVYFGDPSTDGSWMLDASATDFIFRRRVAGSWVVKQTIAG